MKTTKKDECSYSFSNAIRTLAMVRLTGLEPPTYWFVASHSIQLSYCRLSTDSLIILSHAEGKCKP